MRNPSISRLRIRSARREQLLDITTEVRRAVAETGVETGTLHLWSLHTTCGLTVNEGMDPDVASDIVAFVRHLIPRDAAFHHIEGNSDAHVKTALFGPGLTLLVENGAPLLGTWQKIFLAEWDGPRDRTVALLVRGG